MYLRERGGTHEARCEHGSLLWGGLSSIYFSEVRGKRGPSEWRRGMVPYGKKFISQGVTLPFSAGKGVVSGTGKKKIPDSGEEEKIEILTAYFAPAFVGGRVRKTIY